MLEDEDELHIALYLEPTIVARLADEDPFARLHDGNLAAFLLALEGVSHFLYLTWNASFERSVSLLELELQAEVDKYVSTLHLLGRQYNGRVPIDLHQQLFESVVFDPTLEDGQLVRYREANRFAGKYCRSLEARYLREYSGSPMTAELRRFYRLTQNQKIRRIELAN